MRVSLGIVAVAAFAAAGVTLVSALTGGDPSWFVAADLTHVSHELLFVVFTTLGAVAAFLRWRLGA